MKIRNGLAKEVYNLYYSQLSVPQQDVIDSQIWQRINLNVEEKRNAELEKVAVGIDKMATEAAKVWKEYTEAKEVAELEASEDEVKEAKSDEACKLFRELDDDGLVYTKHYGEALCQKQNVQFAWDEDLSVEDIETVIEYFKNLKQLIKLERKVNKLAIYG